MEESELTRSIAKESSTAAAFNRLYELIKRLRAPGGCPWDRDQTPLSMRRDLVEEVFETVDAVTGGDPDHAKEELGDVLFNVCMIAYMYEQQSDFTVADSINGISDKLIRRHPHVFPASAGTSEMTGAVTTSAEVLSQWDRIKEHLEGRGRRSVLDEVPAGFPPLLKAYKYLHKAAKRGFEWHDPDSFTAKIHEELSEVEQASDPLHREEEVGDLLLSVVNYARSLGVDPEVALGRANSKFYNRFTFVEQQMKDRCVPMDSSHTDQMVQFWNEAKEQDL